jgi:hypothetical protein
MGDVETGNDTSTEKCLTGLRRADYELVVDDANVVHESIIEEILPAVANAAFTFPVEINTERHLKIERIIDHDLQLSPQYYLLSHSFYSCFFRGLRVHPYCEELGMMILRFIVLFISIIFAWRACTVNDIEERVILAVFFTGTNMWSGILLLVHYDLNMKRFFTYSDLRQVQDYVKELCVNPPVIQFTANCDYYTRNEYGERGDLFRSCEEHSEKPFPFTQYTDITNIPNDLLKFDFVRVYTTVECTMANRNMEKRIYDAKEAFRQQYVGEFAVCSHVDEVYTVAEYRKVKYCYRARSVEELPNLLRFRAYIHMICVVFNVSWFYLVYMEGWFASVSIKVDKRIVA